MNVSATPIPVARANSRSAGGGADAGDAVAGQHDRVDRAADHVGRLQQLLRARLRPPQRGARRQRLGVDRRSP